MRITDSGQDNDTFIGVLIKNPHLPGANGAGEVGGLDISQKHQANKRTRPRTINIFCIKLGSEGALTANSSNTPLALEESASVRYWRQLSVSLSYEYSSVADAVADGAGSSLEVRTSTKKLVLFGMTL